jgi:hypothetical protein
MSVLYNARSAHKPQLPFAAAGGTMRLVADLDLDQQAVAHAPADERQIVEAAPGCGKTHVACARVAWLVDHEHVRPEAIVLLSFTRTAVHEIRSRIGGLSGNAAAADVRTLDSFAWRIVAGTSEVGDYGDTIRAASARLDRAARGEDPDAKAFVDRLEHVIIDEAQDLVGDRALFVFGLLRSLPASCGWTVFVDPAQAIYGWSSEAKDEAHGRQFLEMLDDLGDHAHRTLGHVYRTDRTDLLSLLSATRSDVLERPAGTRLQAVRETLAAMAAPASLRLSELPGLDTVTDDTLVLFRRRADALLALSYFRDQRGSCRLRIGGHGRVAAPWIAVIGQAIAEQRLHGSTTRAAFDGVWTRACEGRWSAAGWSAEAAWDLLRRLGSRGHGIDMGRVATRLAQRQLPDEAHRRDLGAGGPILGTIHGSKGREAPRVLFMMSDDVTAAGSITAKADEEARVHYVAASRARHQLHVLRYATSPCGLHEDRAWHSTDDGIQIEVGREGDVDPWWPVHLENTEVAAVGDVLASFDGRPQTVVQWRTREHRWQPRLESKGELIGALSDHCANELDALVKQRGAGWHANYLGHLTWIDVTTVAVTEDQATSLGLPFPFNEARMWLAPVIAGMGYMKRFRR